tara:strand:+ start:7214 stop:7642 length:429 start_codon:yes stop_codon:yes gene_type:complete
LVNKNGGIKNMTMTDPIGDMIARIKNAQTRSLNDVLIPASKFRAKILDVMQKEGYIIGYKVLSDKSKKNNLHVNLKYVNGSPVIKEINRISKPGRRIYARANSIPRIQNGLGLAIVSTSKGIMSDNEARTQNVGGEIICKIF